MKFIKRNTIKWKIFQYNLTTITILMITVAVVFSVAIHFYMEQETLSQLETISSRTVRMAVHHGLSLSKEHQTPKPGSEESDNDIGLYIMLNHSLKEPLSLLNAEYVLLDEEKNVVTLFPDSYQDNVDLSYQIANQVIAKTDQWDRKNNIRLSIDGKNYITMTQPLSQDGKLNTGWIIIYASLEKINHLQLMINGILFIILVISLLAVILLSTKLSKKLTEPFVFLNEGIKAIAERDFGRQIKTPVYGELSEMVNSINFMSKKLETYDNAQKTFLQNASHEFRTPLMSIQSYAEGIQYHVVDQDTAVKIILEETKRMENLVKELLYLSRLESIEEKLNQRNVDLSDILTCCINRVQAIADQNHIGLKTEVNGRLTVFVDEEKFSQAIVNLISNSLRYAKTAVFIKAERADDGSLHLSVADDGPGLDPGELPHIFERFYKGKKGNFGLGLAISKSIMEKHGGTISAQNRESGGAEFLITMKLAED